MRKSLSTWLAFGVCLLVVLAAMGWVSFAAVKLDRAEARARRRAELEESVRLALWRMDSALAGLIAREAARPYFHYSAFHAVPRAYTRMYTELKGGEIIVPSPLLTSQSPYVLLHFQYGPGGELTSPQVPAGNMRDVAESGYTTHEQIEVALAKLEALEQLADHESLLRAAPEKQAAPPPQVAEWHAGAGMPLDAQQTARNVIEQQARVQSLQAMNPDGANDALFRRSSDVSQGVLNPLWVGDALLLVRRVSATQRQYLQGSWLDWPAVKEWLLGSVRDILPEADLAPLTGNAEDKGHRALATLPAILAPGEAPAAPPAGPSPILISLVIAWACMLIAAGAVAVLLRVTMALSERRAAFASAVTHELRSPLTTFRMYTEMLAESMVPEESRQGYLDTLCSEAERLSHLVSNVLAYSRLDGRRASSGMADVTVGDLIVRAEDRLTKHAAQAGMTLETSVPDDLRSLSVRADVSAVEQVLFNLVDNACKYAAGAADKRIHLEAEQRDGQVAVRVRDHGPGVSAADARRLFRPFSRPAGTPSPGVGLGLALSRRLARSMRGDLRLEQTAQDGACFALTLSRPGR